MVKRSYPFLLFSVYVLSLFSDQDALAYEDKDVIKVGITAQVKPYVIDNDKAKGLDLELLNAIFSEMAYSTQYYSIPYRRQATVMNNRNIDAIAVWLFDDLDCFVSEPYRMWYNILVSLDRGLETDVQSLSDLKEGDIAAFYRANETILGFKETPLAKFSLLKFAPNAKLALRMLRANRMRAYIGDIYGISYYQKNDQDSQKSVKLKNLYQFKPNPQYLCFRDENLRDRFNQVTKKLRATNILEDIETKYGKDLLLQ
ncbi:transporter substrate-binding domain-containing protein [Temperatibacter marinus]|uniref:Transporter substrate-binding domain-containing protein n=1 Tax=Temperatibacter marinus TaxID=1456591 RepID=A0AA52EJB8_9PROT|nr:transporter substrate-binding domain-containing protein [Temperatibacter marinus]WND03850.1 transporter substrate-binding domain-containing protein [Temperatibacter marinus]